MTTSPQVWTVPEPIPMRWIRRGISEVPSVSRPLPEAFSSLKNFFYFQGSKKLMIADFLHRCTAPSVSGPLSRLASVYGKVLKYSGSMVASSATGTPIKSVRSQLLQASLNSVGSPLRSLDFISSSPIFQELFNDDVDEVCMISVDGLHGSRNHLSPAFTLCSWGNRAKTQEGEVARV
ncbi:uncharacterized protein LOC114881643 isoform X1 [Osmia bicornis bicornis]|uniref:uncharacterized protein LOC114881643 isoform X1 n=1 Tax=Osmia bicornis bicornis TaxID=1437191 RepID=UPI0010F5A86B|nr:uncharacterized protein LOC114881643 isoform X1 [Osmia bicornis bicornis]